MVGVARRYWVVEALGRGGFGTVYRAEMLGAGGFRKTVALKMLNADRMDDEETAGRLRDEARLLGQIRHEAILQVDALVRLQGHWTVVMEYLSGASLTELLGSAAIPLRCAVEIGAQVASALHAVHSAADGDHPLGLVHRDVKPSNIMVSRTGGVKVLDFGIARAESPGRESITSECIFGAPEYMAPERWTTRDLPESDVYSLGVVLWEMMVGRHLGRTSSHPGHHAELVLKSMGRLSPELPAELHDLLVAMLAYDPEDRPAAREVELRCRDLLPELPGPWLSDWAEDHVPRALGRRPRIADDPVVGQVLEEEGGSHPEGRRLPWRWFAGAGAVVVLGGVGWALWPAPPAADPVPSAAEAGFPGPEAATAVEAGSPGPEATAAVEAGPGLPPPASEPVAAPPSPGASSVVRAPVAPAVVPATAAPAPRSPPAPDPGMVLVDGDAADVVLIGAGGRFPPGPVPPGVYTVEARFAEQGRWAGTVEVASGERRSVRCDSAFALCVVR